MTCFSFSRPTLALAVSMASITGCASSLKQLPKQEQSAIETLEQLTGHRHLHPWRTPQILEKGLDTSELLGRVIKTDAQGDGLVLGPSAWKGPIVGLTDADRPIRIELREDRLAGIKVALQQLFGVKFGGGYKHRVRLEVDWHPIRLQEPQPALEHLGDEEIFSRTYVSSIAFASKIRMHSFVERKIEGGIELVPLSVVKLGLDASASAGQSNVLEAQNVIFGYQLQDGKSWLSERIDAFPKVGLQIVNPAAEQVIQSPRVRVQVKVPEYATLGANRGRLQVYAWIQKIGANEGTLSTIGAPVDQKEGLFELVTNLGGLEDGNGERFSITTFALFYRLHNVDSRTRLPATSFARPARDNGSTSVVVTRRDVIN